MTTVVELRCERYGRLLGKIRHGQGVELVDGQFVEQACVACRKELRDDGQRVALVLHLFRLDGQLADTVVVGVGVPLTPGPGSSAGTS